MPQGTRNVTTDLQKRTDIDDLDQLLMVNPVTKEPMYLEWLNIFNSAFRRNYIPTIADLETFQRRGQTYVIVTEEGRGGPFMWYAEGSGHTPDGGTVFVCADGGYWVRFFTKYVNVKWFKAKGNGVTDDTLAIQSAVSYIGSKRKVLFFPSGTYLVTGKFLFENLLYIGIKGTPNSIVLNTGTTSTFHFKNTQRFFIEDLRLEGEGANFGIGATNLHGIELENSHNWNFTRLQIERNGGHGIYAYGGMWIGSLVDCIVSKNKLNGFDSVNQTGNLQNGNALSIVGSSFDTNGGHGIRWGASAIDISGACVFEKNGGIGIVIDAKSTSANVSGININGNYFEANEGGAIRFICAGPAGALAARSVVGAIVEGNYIFGSTSEIDQPEALVYVESDFFNGFLSSKIGVNHYAPGISKSVKVELGHWSSSVWVNTLTADKFDVNTGGEIKIDQNNRTLALSGMAYQKSIPWALPRRSDNFISQPVKNVYFSLPYFESNMIQNIKVLIETDATSYDVTILIYGADATTVTGLSNKGSKSSLGLAGTQTISWRTLESSYGGRLLLNNTYYLRIAISNVVGGSFMFMNDPILNIV